MKNIPLLQKEFTKEATITRKFINQLPGEQLTWRPHAKSMDLKDLAVHLARLLEWVYLALNSSELDLTAHASQQSAPDNAKQIQKLFEETVEKGKAALNRASEEDLQQEWTMRKGDQILATWTKYEAVRTAIDHEIHHRAQLGVYFRLLDISVPATYFRSADAATY